jgi:hypothetical protein
VEFSLDGQPVGLKPDGSFTLRRGVVWSKYSNALNYRGLRTGRAQFDCAVRGF